MRESGKAGTGLPRTNDGESERSGARALAKGKGDLMTMRIVIKNEDTTRTAFVDLVPVADELDAAPFVRHCALAPGQDTAVYVHSGQSVLVSEKPAE